MLTVMKLAGATLMALVLTSASQELPSFLN